MTADATTPEQIMAAAIVTAALLFIAFVAGVLVGRKP